MSPDIAASIWARLLATARERGEEVGTRVRSFLLPIRDSIVAGVPFDLGWAAKGPWG